MNKDKVLDLAKLARIEIRDDEAESLSRDFEAILGYVSEIKKLEHVFSNDEILPCRKDLVTVNVMREDGEPHESGLYTDKILEQAPAREGGYIKVKKIL